MFSLKSFSYCGCRAANLAGAANAVAAGTFLALMRRRSRLAAEAVSREPRGEE